jgi:hypothetical protein
MGKGRGTDFILRGFAGGARASSERGRLPARVIQAAGGASTADIRAITSGLAR